MHQLAPFFNRVRRISVLPAAIAMVFLTSTAGASVVFFDDFEAPGVTSEGSPFNGVPRTSQQASSDWVRASPGFGASSNGLLNEVNGAFTDPDGEQAYGFRYTNSGVTTAQGAVGAIAPGDYTVSFDVALDAGFDSPSGTPWRAELVAFNSSQGNSARAEHRGGRVGNILASDNGNATTDGSWTTITLPTQSFATGDPLIGEDFGIRFLGATRSAVIDDVSVDFTPIPEPSKGLLLLLGSAGLLLRRRSRR